MDCPVFGAGGVLADQFAFGPLAGRVLGQAVHTRDAEEPRFYVLRVLTDRFAAAEGITVTKAEIDAFLASTAAALARDRAEAVERRDTLKREQAAGKLPAERKTQVEREIASAEQLIADLAPATGAAVAEEGQARAEVAAAFIRQWKINGALQRKYGGRIIFQQAGPEPLDATRRFLDAAQAAGDLAIVDPALEKPFWAYYRDADRTVPRLPLCRLPVAGRGRTDHEGGLQESARCGLFQPAAAGFGGDGDVCRTVRPALHEPF